MDVGNPSILNKTCECDLNSGLLLALVHPPALNQETGRFLKILFDRTRWCIFETPFYISNLTFDSNFESEFHIKIFPRSKKVKEVSGSVRIRAWPCPWSLMEKYLCIELGSSWFYRAAHKLSYQDSSRSMLGNHHRAPVHVCECFWRQRAECKLILKESIDQI